MLQTNGRRWGLATSLGALVLLGLLPVGPAATAAQSCRHVSGHFTLQPVSGPLCASPVGICAGGAYAGPLAGPLQFTGSSLIPTVDTPSTGVVILTGDSVITTTRGLLRTKDAAALQTTGAGDFGELITIVGGTGDWLGAAGTLRTQGTFTATDGGAGTYDGEVCRP
jgi:hypothetical protein